MISFHEVKKPGVDEKYPFERHSNIYRPQELASIESHM